MKNAAKAIVIFFLMILITLPMTAYAKATDESQFTYTLENDEITITSYIGSDVSVVIPKKIDRKPVVAIGSKAFLESNISKIVIPRGVRSIGSAAFRDCKYLTSVELPDTIISIGGWAFDGTEALKSIKLPEGNVKMGDGAFHSSGLKSITIPAGYYLDLNDCTSVMGVPMPKGWFSSCLDLREVRFAEGTKEIYICEHFDGYIGKGDNYYGAKEMIIDHLYIPESAKLTLLDEQHYFVNVTFKNVHVKKGSDAEQFFTEWKSYNNTCYYLGVDHPGTSKYGSCALTCNIVTDQ